MLVSKDPTWAIAKPMYWSVIETNIGILAASIPSFKPVARRYLPRLIGEYSSRDRSYPGGSSSRNTFGKLPNGGEWSGSVPLKPYNKDGTTTTVITSQRGGHNGSGLSKTSSGSEQSLVSNSAGRITQSTHVTQKIEPLSGHES